MTPEQFCYWLQGFSELGCQAPSAEQWKAIDDHLATVFTKITPPRDLGEILLGEILREAFPDKFGMPQVTPFPPKPFEGPFC